MKKILHRAAWLSAVLLILMPGAFLAVHGEAGRDLPPVEKFQTPEGFEVEVAATPAQTGSVVNMTFDSRGRPVLAREKEGIFVLEDRDQDGRFETFLTFTDQVRNSHGLCFVGHDLYAVGEGPQGTALYRIVDHDGDTQGDRVELVGKFQGNIGEHGPHALKIGPEGLLYVVIGNHAGIRATPHPLSPHRNYQENILLPRYFDPSGHARQIRAPGGTIFRVDFEGRNWELFAGGFRNQYDAAFNLAGELFTFDADMEWDLGLPWFRPVRTHHVVPGGEYGWRSGTGKWPDYFIDSLPSMTDVGRGSPVGVEFYHHYVYPEKYHGAFLLGDWSRGRILAGFLERSGATYKEMQEDLVVGQPINITDLEVGPDGFVYYTTGGRNTQGGLYRIAYRGPDGNRKVPQQGLEGALHQPQPRSAWGRARLAQMKSRLGPRWGEGLLAKVTDEAADPVLRIRALELLQVYGPAPPEGLLVKWAEDSAVEVRAAATYYLGLHPTSGSRSVLLKKLQDSDAFVQRRACEALVRTGINRTMKLEDSFIETLWPLLGHSSRWVRYAARELIERTERNFWKDRALTEKDPVAAVEGLLGLVETVDGTWDMDQIMEREVALLRSGLSDQDLLRFLRVLQLSFVHDRGIQRLKITDAIGQSLLDRFPSGNWRVNREIARILTYFETPGIVGKLLEAIAAEEGNREQQIFYAYCLQTISNGWTADQKDAFIGWFEKTQKENWRGGYSFKGFLEKMWNTWLQLLPDNEKEKAMARLPQLSPMVAGAGKKRIPTFRREGWSQRLSEQELTEFLLWDPMAYKGSPPQGKMAYQKAFCDRCHRFGEMGMEAGPDLTTVGGRFSRQDLIEAIVFPSRTVSDLWQAVEVTTRDGKSYLGTLTSEDGRNVTLQQMDGSRIQVPKADIVNRDVSEKSPMPEGLLNALTPEEVWDLFAFLEDRSN